MRLLEQSLAWQSRFCALCFGFARFVSFLTLQFLQWLWYPCPVHTRPPLRMAGMKLFLALCLLCLGLCSGGLVCTGEANTLTFESPLFRPVSCRLMAALARRQLDDRYSNGKTTVYEVEPEFVPVRRTVILTSNFPPLSAAGRPQSRSPMQRRC
jgi:hypothetical protein